MLENRTSTLITWCIYTVKNNIMAVWTILLKFVGQKPEKKWNYTFKKLPTPLSTTTQKISPKVINLSNMFLTKHEIEILKLGLSFTLTPKPNICELETDIYHFIGKLCWTYRFCVLTYEDKSIVKNESHLHQKILKIKN